MMRTKTVLIFVLTLLSIALPSFAQNADDNREYDVTIAFIGLMSFDLGDAYKAGDPVTVIIPNLSKGAMLQGNTTHIPEHVSYLLADREVMSDSDPINSDFHFIETPHASDNFVYLPFNGFHISIDEENEIAALNAKLDLDNTDCIRCPDKAGENGKFCWISSMKAVHKDKPQQRDDAYFARHDPPLSKKEVAGRMILRYGTLKAYVVGHPSFKKAAIFDFEGSKVSQALAQEVHWTFKARGVPFILNLASVKAGGSNQRVAFIPTLPADRQKLGKLTIIIGNTMPKDAGPIATPATVDTDKHYAAYHRFIAKNPDGYGPLPEPHQKAKDEIDYCVMNLEEPILLKLLREAPKNRQVGKANHPTADTNPAPGGLNCSPTQWP
jgi:hypothetical protein